MSIGVEQFGHAPALPVERQELYSVSESEMPLNPNDREEIKSMISSLSPSTRKGAWWKDSLPIAVIMGGVCFLAYQFVPAQIASQTSGLAADVAVLKSDVGTIKSDLTEIRKDIKDQLIKALESARQDAHKEVTGDAKRGALQFGTRILKLATDFKVSIGEAELTRYGGPIVQAAFTRGSGDNPEIRSAADAILNYRSFLGSQEMPEVPQSKPSTDWAFDYEAASKMYLQRYPRGDGYMYFVGSGGGKSKGATGPVAFLGFTVNDPNQHWKPQDVIPRVAYLGGVVPLRESATVELVNPAEDFVKQRTRGPVAAQYIVIQAAPGTTLFLDHLKFKNVIFVNSRIEYWGGSTILENVVFSNCTFGIAPTAKSVQFATSILAPGKTNFKG